MDRTIPMMIDGDAYVAIPAAEYNRLAGIPEPTPAPGLAGTDAVAYVRQTMGRDLRAARNYAGLSQAALAAELAITQGSVANIEAGRTRIGEALVRRWMKGCKLPMNWKPV